MYSASPLSESPRPHSSEFARHSTLLAPALLAIVFLGCGSTDGSNGDGTAAAGGTTATSAGAGTTGVAAATSTAPTTNPATTGPTTNPGTGSTGSTTSTPATPGTTVPGPTPPGPAAPGTAGSPGSPSTGGAGPGETTTGGSPSGGTGGTATPTPHPPTAGSATTGDAGSGGQPGLGSGAGAGGQATTAGAGGTPGTGEDPVYSPCPDSGSCAILPLGDSITEGFASSGGGYRVELFRQAVQNGHDITFVGSAQNGPNDVDGHPFPKAHEGHGGYQIDSGPGFSGISGQITESALDNYHPNIVLLMIGTNDINGNNDLGQAPTRLANLIDSITSRAPEALVVVSSILPIERSGADNDGRVYNQAIPGLVDERAAAGQHVVFVDSYGPFTADPNYASSLMSDYLHPNDTGYALLGQTFYDALEPYLPSGTLSLSRPATPSDLQFALRPLTPLQSPTEFGLFRSIEPRAADALGRAPFVAWLG